MRTEHKQIPKNSWHRPLSWPISFIVFAFILSRPRYPHAPTIVPLRRRNRTKTPRDASAYTEPRQKGLPDRPCPMWYVFLRSQFPDWLGRIVLRKSSDLTQSPLGLLGTNFQKCQSVPILIGFVQASIFISHRKRVFCGLWGLWEQKELGCFWLHFLMLCWMVQMYRFIKTGHPKFSQRISLAGGYCLLLLK